MPLKGDIYHKMLDLFLVLKAKKGDPDAFVSLFKSYEPVLYNAAYKVLHDEQDVADVMQETALLAFQKISQLKNINYFNTWLYRIMMNQCYQIHQKRIPKIDISEVETISNSTSEDTIIFNELLNDLDIIYRIPLVLYYTSGFSIKEISQILEEPVGTVKSKLSRGRALLQKEFISIQGDDYCYGKI